MIATPAGATLDLDEAARFLGLHADTLRERNRRLATDLRRGSYNQSDLNNAADALDGGER